MRAKYFPWRLFQKFFVTLLLLLNLSFVLILAAASYVFDFHFYRGPTFLLLGSFLVVSVLFSAYFAYRFAQPMRRVILKALRLANKKQAQSLFDSDDEDLLDAEPGEYFELEQALNKIRKKIKKRRLELAHEREESQALMSSLQDAVVSVRPDGKVGFFNSRFATLFLGPDQLKPHMEGTPLQLTSLFRDPEILKKFDHTLKVGVVERLQMKLPTFLEPNGRYFSVTISPLREEKNRLIYGILILFHDISEIKTAEKMRIEFVENASHELRTPLTSMKGFLETAREDLKAGRGEQVPQFLEIVSKSVDRLTNLVNDMLTISSLENKVGLQFELIHPEILTQDVFEQLVPLASEKQIMLKLAVESGPFRADPIMVERVLINLIGNSIKYIQIGGQIEVRWSLDRQNKLVILKVSDNGPGIAEEHLSRLFERFYRIEKSRSRDVGGTGLGLAIVKHILQTHGGNVSALSQLGQGAEFVCEFPYRT